MTPLKVKFFDSTPVDQLAITATFKSTTVNGDFLSSVTHQYADPIFKNDRFGFCVGEQIKKACSKLTSDYIQYCAKLGENDIEQITIQISGYLNGDRIRRTLHSISELNNLIEPYKAPRTPLCGCYLS